MTIQQFSANYQLRFRQTVTGDAAAFYAEAVDRKTGATALSQKVEISISEMNDGILLSQSRNSINVLTADDVIDTTRRYATDLLFILCQVQDYFPLNKENDIYQLQN